MQIGERTDGSQKNIVRARSGLTSDFAKWISFLGTRA